MFFLLGFSGGGGRGSGGRRGGRVEVEGGEVRPTDLVLSFLRFDEAALGEFAVHTEHITDDATQKQGRRGGGQVVRKNSRWLCSIHTHLSIDSVTLEPTLPTNNEFFPSSASSV